MKIFARLFGFRRDASLATVIERQRLARDYAWPNRSHGSKPARHAGRLNSSRQHHTAR